MAKDVNAWAEQKMVCQKCGAESPPKESTCPDGSEHDLRKVTRFRKDLDLHPPSLHMA